LDDAVRGGRKKNGAADAQSCYGRKGSTTKRGPVIQLRLLIDIPHDGRRASLNSDVKCG